MLDQVRRTDSPIALAVDTQRVGRAIAQLLAIVLPVAVYVRTLPPTFYNIDSAELTTAARTIGIPHPPGYPLYVLVGHAFTWLPIGDYGYRVNLMSAAFAALTLYFMYRIVLRLTREPVAGIATCWALGFSYPFWSNAIVAEVYTLDTALLSGLVLFLLRWRDERKSVDLYIAALLFGLSLTNRTTNLLSAPAIVLFLLPMWRTERRTIISASMAALPPLALYALLPLRSMQDAGYRWGASYNIQAARMNIDLSDPAELWWYISSRVFRDLIRIYPTDERAAQAWYFARDAWWAFLGGGLIIAAMGAVWIARRHPPAAMLLGLIALPQAIFYINYAAPDKQTMFLAVYVVVAVLIGCGVAQVTSWLRDEAGVRRPSAYAAAGTVVAALLLIQTNFSLLDLSRDDRARVDAEGLMAIADDDAVVIGRWTDIAPLEYMQTVEHQRQDVALIHQWAVPREQLRELVDYNINSGRAVYVYHRDDPVLDDYYGFIPVGDWFRLSQVKHVVSEAP